MSSRRLLPSFSFRRSDACGCPPGSPHPPRRNAGTAAAPISRCSPPTRTKVELCLFDSQGRRETRAHRAAGAHRGRLARLSQRRRARASSTAIACTAPMSPSTATASTPTSCCSIPTPSGWRAGLSGAMRISAIAPAAQASRPVVRPARQRARHAQGRRGRRPRISWGTASAGRDPVGRHHHLRGPRQGTDADCARTCRRGLRGTYRRPVVAGDDRASQAARRHRDRTAADPRLSRRPACWSSRA